MRRTHTERIMILVDNIWRIAKAVPDTHVETSGIIQAELNGMIITAKAGQWYNISESWTEDQIRNTAIQNNIEQLLYIASQKANHRKLQAASAERLRRAEQIAQAAPQNIPQPRVERPADQIIRGAIILEDEDRFEDFMDREYDECDCEDCRKARGEV